MPDTPIDLSEGIQSVRLKVPTAEVPIPPEGFAQLHSPAPGELALRLPDGSVVAVGGGGGGGGAATSVLGPGGAIDAANSDPRIGININAASGTGIALTGRLLNQFADPYPFDALALATREDAPEEPEAGRTLLWLSQPGVFRSRSAFGGTGLTFLSGTTYVAVAPGAATVSSGDGDSSVSVTPTGVEVYVLGTLLTVTEAAITLALNGAALVVTGLPTVDPAVADQLWINPATRALTVSAG